MRTKLSIIKIIFFSLFIFVLFCVDNFYLFFNFKTLNFDFYYKISFQKTNLNKLIVIFHQLTIQFQFKFFLSSSSRFNPFINQLSPSSHFLINHVCFISMHCLYHQSIQNQPLHIVIASLLFINIHQRFFISHQIHTVVHYIRFIQ